jgi:hypothetical protein
MLLHAVLFNIHNPLWHYSKDRLNFIKHLNAKPIKRVRIEGNYFRYRIRTPNKKYRFVSKKLNNDTILVFMIK